MTLTGPVLNESELESLFKDPYLKAQTIPTFFDIRKGLDGSLIKTLNKICEAADEAVRNGCQLLVLSDRADELVSTLCVCVCMLLKWFFRLIYLITFQFGLCFISSSKWNGSNG